MDAIHRRISRSIRAHAKARGILITHLPDRAGVGRSSFFMVITGKTSPTVRWLAKIAAALDCDVADLTSSAEPRAASRPAAPTKRASPRPRN